MSVVVPTKNERENVIRLIDRLEAALPTVGMEIVFVDASTDGTAETIEEMGPRSERDVVLVRQSAGRRNGGLGAAVVQGLRAARAPWACVMDADLQHPPELIPELLEQADSREIDVVVASRYCDGGDARGLG
ncbi:MAG TPA: glycosyltransferase, partial [Thermoleophilaceae bacterium]|nr:glycosyltransferase [Thermoleophilaceae bacterium]